MRKDTEWEDRASSKVHKNPVRNFVTVERGKIESERETERVQEERNSPILCLVYKSLRAHCPPLFRFRISAQPQ